MPGPWKRLTIMGWSAASVTTLILAWSFLQPEPPQPVSRQVLSTGGWAGLDGPPFGEYAALAPDGSSMILPVGDQWALKMRNSTEITPIPGTEGGRNPVYSPDGQWIAYAVGSEVFKRPLVGGSTVRLAEDVESPPSRVGLAWLDDGTILYEPANPITLVQIPEDGGEPLVVFEENLRVFWVHGLPDARGALVVTTDNALHVVDLRDPSSEVILEEVVRAWYTPTGHVVYVREDGAFFAVPFDLNALKLRGSAIPLFEGVRTTGATADMRLAADGTLMYVEREGGALAIGHSHPSWVERDGTAREIDPGWRTPGAPNNSSLALSPNEDRLAISIRDSEGTYDLWVKQLDMGPLSRLTFEGTINRRVIWSPDGQSLTFISNRAGQDDLWTKRADGSGSVDVVLDRESRTPEAFYSPDSTWLVFREGGGGSTDGDIFAIRPGVDSIAVPLVATDFGARSPALSPDGRWLAYVSNEAGREEIYVRPFPDADSGRWLVSADGGAEPVWAHSGLELFYRNGANELVAVQVSAGSSFAWDRQDVLFSMADYLLGNGHPMYDVSPDDERFVMLRIGNEENAAASELILVTNFFEELRQRMGN